MGAVCYKPRPTSISKDEVLRALNDKHLRETITEPSDAKSMRLKTNDVSHNHQLDRSSITIKESAMMVQGTFGRMSMKLSQDDLTIFRQVKDEKQDSKKRKRENSQSPRRSKEERGVEARELEINIMSYFGHKEEIYQTLMSLSRRSLYFMRKNYKNIEKIQKLDHCNESIRFIQVKSIEEHQSGVNQLLKLPQNSLVTASDDCYLKFWSSTTLKVECSLPTETITCIALTGVNKDILVAGCHSGNLLLINIPQKAKKEQITSAHYNLIRVIVSLEALKNRYYVTADVCGIVKVWSSQYKSPSCILNIEQEGAISYNSMIELVDVLPRSYEENNTALIACALKSQKINLIVLMPTAQPNPNFQIIKTLRTLLKPTCLIQISTKHIAIAVGSLKEEPCIEIHKIMSSGAKTILSQLKGVHKDMIDSMYKLDFNISFDKKRSSNPYVQWFLSASRDRQIVLWKLMDGRIMKRNIANLIASNKKAQQQLIQQPQDNGVRAFADIKKGAAGSNNGMIFQGSRKDNKKKQQRQAKDKNGSGEGGFDDQDEDEEESALGGDDDEEDDVKEEQDIKKEEEKVPLLKGNSSTKTLSSQNLQQLPIQQGKLIDYYYAFDTGHKDFVRSMAQINSGNTLVTASEDKTIKIFTIAF